MKPKYALMFGYRRNDENDLAYFAVIDNKIAVTSEEELAKHFPYKKRRGQKGFGTPQQWLEMINEDPHLNKGYVFHLVNKIELP